MPERPIGVTDEPSGAAVADYRTRERVVGGATVVEQYVLRASDRVASCKAMAATHMIQASGAGAPLAYLFNRVGSGTLVAVRRALLVVTNTSNTGAARGLITSRVTAEPTGGTQHPAVLFDSAGVASASVAFKGAASADELVSAITTTLGPPAWTQVATRLASLASQVLAGDDLMLPDLSRDDPPVLREGEGLVFSYNPVDIPSSVARHVVSVVWEEFTLP